MVSRGLRETLIFVCSYGCLVALAGVWCPARCVRWQARDWRRLPPFSSYKPVFNGQTTHRKNTQKSKFLVIPEMPSKTFAMLYKKNFLITLTLPWSLEYICQHEV